MKANDQEIIVLIKNQLLYSESCELILLINQFII